MVEMFICFYSLEKFIKRFLFLFDDFPACFDVIVLFFIVERRI